MPIVILWQPKEAVMLNSIASVRSAESSNLLDGVICVMKYVRGLAEIGI